MPNDIYNFLKENNLTTKDEQSFVNEYSNPKKAEELHQFMVNNNLTTKDSATFYNTYFKPNVPQGTPKPQQTYTPSTEQEKRLAEKELFGNRPSDIKGTIPSIKPIETKQETLNKLKEYVDIRKDELNDAITKTAKNRLKSISQKGDKYVENEIDPKILKEEENKIKAAKENGDLVLVKDPKGGYYLSRPQGFLESAGNSLYESINSPVTAWDINKKAAQGDDKGLVQAFEEEDKADRLLGKYPENVPQGTASFLGQTLGGLPKPVAMMAASELTGSPYPAVAMMGAEQAWSNYQHNLRRLYEEELANNPDISKEDAMAKARSAANKEIAVDAASGGTMALMLGGEGNSLFKSVVNRLPNQTAKEAFVNSAKNMLKHTIDFSRVGAATEMTKGEIEAQSGYKRDINDILKSGWQGFSDMALMDFAMKVVSPSTYSDLAAAPKVMKSYAKEYLATLPEHLVDRTLFEMGEQGEKIRESLDKYREVRKQFEGVVPDDKVGTFAGWQEKINGLKEQNQQLELKKVGITEAAHEPINKQIEANNEKIKAAEETLKKYLKTGKIVEKDDLTGDILNEPIKAEENAKEQPSEVGGISETPIQEEAKISTTENIEGVGKGNELNTTEEGSVAETKPIEVVQPTEKELSKNADLMRTYLDEYTSEEGSLTLEEKDNIHSAINDYEDGKINGEQVKQEFVKNGVSEDFLSRKISESGLNTNLELPTTDQLKKQGNIANEPINTETNADKISSTEGVDVGKQAENGSTMGKGNTKGQETTKESGNVKGVNEQGQVNIFDEIDNANKSKKQGERINVKKSIKEKYGEAEYEKALDINKNLEKYTDYLNQIKEIEKIC